MNIPQPMQFENPIAEKIFQTNIELNNNIQQQAEALISLHTSFDLIDWRQLEFSEKKRLEAIKCWCVTLLENINQFNLHLVKKKIKELSLTKVQSIEDQKKELDKLTNFIVVDMEVPDFSDCEWSVENEDERPNQINDEAAK
ncbi:MAG TPA: hypothetical protein VMZ91_10685 [Candidatus Paceibacterota bacterium]|nr:hypothetical protein [Candidatus Paceibacterota bacterium]